MSNDVTILPPENGPKRGQPGCGLGRTPGATGRVPSAVKQMVLDALDEAGGKDYLLMHAFLNPKEFLTLVGKVLPLEIKTDGAPLVMVNRIECVIVDPPKR